MKLIITKILVLLFIVSGVAQVPQAFNYQGVARDLSNTPLVDQSISLQISILEGTPNGPAVYKETHAATTSSLGLFSLQIGTGTVVDNSFDEVDWSTGNHYLQIEIDENGGVNYQLLGASQLLSVPYALYSGNSGDTKWEENNRGIDYNNGNVGIGTSLPSNLLEVELAEEGSLIDQGIVLKRNNGALRMVNGTNLPGEFQARISGIADSEISPGLALVGTPSINDATARGIILRAGEFAPMSNGNLLEVENFTSTQMVLDHRGYLGLGTDSPSNLMEIRMEDEGQSLYKGFEISRNQGYLKLVNGTNFSGKFQARISGRADSDISPGLAIVGTPSVNNSTARGITLRAGEFTPMSNGNLIEVDNYTNTQMVIDYQGNLGLGNTSPKAKLQVTNGDVYIEDINKGVIMKSPDGQCWRYTPDNTGALVPTAIICPN